MVMWTWILLMTAAAQTLTITEASGQLAPGVTDSGGVEVEADSFMPFAMVGMWSGSLAQPTILDGVPCAAAPVRIEQGRLTACTLSETAQVGPLTLPADSHLKLIPTQQPQRVFQTTLPAALTVDGRRYPAGETLIFHPDGAVWFRIQSAVLAPEVLSLPCRWGREADKVLLHPDGTLAQCILREPSQVGDHRLPTDTIVALNPTGRLTRADLREPWGEHGGAGRVLFGLDGAITEVRNKYTVHEDDNIHHPSWWVHTGFYYGYPWAE
ncbi:MAG: hypothetical protein ACI8RZ_000496 [Myxococcota bacterium]|jgi:hypothetical protein